MGFIATNCTIAVCGNFISGNFAVSVYRNVDCESTGNTVTCCYNFIGNRTVFNSIVKFVNIDIVGILKCRGSILSKFGINFIVYRRKQRRIGEVIA